MRKKDLDVVVIGNVGVDTQIYLAGQEIDYSLEANFTENKDCVGQAGGYAARCYARMGFRTGFIGYLGDDFLGDHIKNVFQREGIDTSGIFIDPAGTSRSINIVYRDGRRRNFYDGKSHMVVKPDLVRCYEILSRTQLAHFNIPNWARTLLPLAHEIGLPVACDIQDIVDPRDPYRKDFIQAADYLFFSAVNHPDPSSIIDHYLRENPHQVIVAGRGEQGCALGVDGNVEMYGPAVLDLPVVDTNGAGDVLASVFLISHVFQHRSLEESIKRGQIAARIICSQKTPKDDLITDQQLEKYMIALNFSHENDII